MESGSITGYIDVAQVVLYAFWIFFAALIIYLRREDKREGYPLDSDRANVQVVGFPSPPPPKTFNLPDGSSVTVPREEPDLPIAAEPLGPWLGAPLVPTGDPLEGGIGPGSYSNREPHPDVTVDGEPKIVPLRTLPDFQDASQDPDPRGYTVVGTDGVPAGVVSDIWVDRSDPLVRYFEYELTGEPGSPARKVLVPYNFAHIIKNRRLLLIQTLLSEQLTKAPSLAQDDQITLLEEDKVSAFYAAGLLYSQPEEEDS